MCKKATTLSQMQDAFNPSPLVTRGELEEFYQETSYARTGDQFSDFVQNLSLQLEDSAEVVQHKLFIGHPGCGKTTELYQLLQKTQDAGFIACLGRCDLELDSADVEYTDVLFLVLDLIVKAAVDNGITLSTELVKEIRDYWEQDVEVVREISKQEESEIAGGGEAAIGIAGLFKIFSEIKGIIKNSSVSRKQIRQRIEPQSSELIAKIQQVIDEISNKSVELGKKKIPLVILDGLDKIPLEQARKIFRENGARFADLKIHLIVTFPIALTYTPEYSDIMTWFPNPEKLPMIKLRKWEGDRYAQRYEEGLQTMKRIVERRAEQSLFEGGVLELLIKQTGGYIRDLFRCITRAATRARIREAEKISMEDAEMALGNLESDINARYSADMIPVMEKIYKGEKFVSASEDMTKLLQIGAVLEYNGQRWCDLHPLVEKWLKKNKKI